MEITSERNQAKEEGYRHKKRKMLQLVSRLFEEFDLDQGHTLDESEIPVMLKALIRHESDLEQVR